MKERRELMKGSIDYLLLYLVGQKPTYGYQLIKELEIKSAGYFKFKEGTLYPALHRMETGKLIISSWQSSNGRQRKYYSITEKGLKLLTVEKTQWLDFLNAMRLIIEPLVI
ncbi:MAG: helix-turn-helix transcriptional regulator [Chloroflexi bacterium]|nr:helix-turn-helix transcriptional regulator [Chloroflexota bacterium]